MIGGRDRTQADFDAEIESHIEHETDRLIAEGRTHAEARAAARARFGSVLLARERFHASGSDVALERLYGQIARQTGQTEWKSIT